MKVRITENQYGQLVEQSIKERAQKLALKKLGIDWDEVQGFIKRLQNPTEKDFNFLTDLSRTKLKAILKLVPRHKKSDTAAPTLYPIPTIGKIEKYINSCYGYRTSTGTNRLHGGVDLDTKGVSPNQPLIATCAGTVVSATETGDCGGFIKLDCNNGDSVGYCHLRVVNENLYGLQIPRGFPIGVSGGGVGDPVEGRGNSGGPHLHYMTWKGGEKINPIKMIEGGYSIPAGGRENRSGDFCNPNAK